MKKKGKSKLFKVVCIGLVVLMVISCFAPLFTYATSVENEHLAVTGKYNGNFKLSTDEEKLFDIFNATPGDKYTGKIVVKNEGPDRMEISIKDIQSTISDTALYDTLLLNIKYKDKVIYNGKYGATPDPVSEVFTVNSRSEIVFDVTVEFPAESPNSLQGKNADILWTFEAKYYEKDIRTGVDLQEETEPVNPVPYVVIGLGLVIIVGSIYMIIRLKRKDDKE